VRKTVKETLEGLGVRLIPNSTVSKVTEGVAGTVLELTSKDGTVTTMTTDVYLSATGVAPNSDYVPEKMLDAQGHVKQAPTLQAQGYPDIFVAGDVGSLESAKVYQADLQANHVAKALQQAILGATVPEYKLLSMDGMGVTLGRSKAVGQMGTWRVPGIMIWYLKGRTMMVGKIDGLFA
jgi:NADH dehydrogenase FAD-containing subunit